jgi:hypothetical protein
VNVPQNHPFSPAIGTAQYFDLITGDLDPQGKPLNRFRPDAKINRAETAKLVALLREAVK